MCKSAYNKTCFENGRKKRVPLLEKTGKRGKKIRKRKRLSQRLWKQKSYSQKRRGKFLSQWTKRCTRKRNASQKTPYHETCKEWQDIRKRFGFQRKRQSPVQKRRKRICSEKKVSKWRKNLQQRERTQFWKKKHRREKQFRQTIQEEQKILHRKTRHCERGRRIDKTEQIYLEFRSLFPTRSESVLRDTNCCIITVG